MDKHQASDFSLWHKSDHAQSEIMCDIIKQKHVACMFSKEG